MNERRAFLLCQLLLVALSIPRLLGAQHVDAQQVVQKVYEQASFRTLEMRASLTIFDRQGQSEKKEFRYRRINDNQESKTRIDIIAPAEEKGVVLLAVQPPGLPASQYFYTPITNRVRSLGTQNQSARFLGSDFIFNDFVDRNPAEYTYRLLGDNEKIDGQETYKIESRPLHPKDSPYAYVFLWVLKKAPVIVYAQTYAASGNMTRVLHATDLRHEAGVWGMRRTEISTVTEHTRSVLTLQNVKSNQPLENAIFSPQGLGSPTPIE